MTDGPDTAIRRSLLKRGTGEDPLFSLSSALLPETDDLRLEPTLFLTREGLAIGLRVGAERLYVVRHIPHFLRDLRQGAPISFGKGFDLDPHLMRFDEAQSALLSVLEEFCDASGLSGTLTGSDARVLVLRPLTAVRVLETLEALPFRLSISGETTQHAGVEKRELSVVCQLSGSVQALKAYIRCPSPMYRLTQDFSYVFCEGTVVRVSDKQRTLLNAIGGSVLEGEAEFFYSGQEVPRFLTEVLPILSSVASVTIDESLSRRLIHRPLKSSVYLDKAGDGVSARVKFCYGEDEIDPFEPQKESRALLLRDAAGESAVMQVLSRAGFHVTRGVVYLTKQSAVYDFIMEGVRELTQVAEVFFSKEFKRLSPRRPALSGRMSVKNGGLNLTLMDEGADVEELMPLMRALSEKRRYFRYKSGAFLDLSDAGEWQALAQAVVEAADEKDDRRPLALCRAAYLRALIEQAALPVALDEETRAAADLRYNAPPPPFDGLRPYQTRGYEWLMTLDALQMGGILADDMGLGKTVQMIAAIARYCMDDKTREPSLIVAPTSLQFNWLSEIRRFAPRLNVLLIRGSQAQRAEQIAQIGENAPDVVLTSYPLIRRDIDLMENIPFRFAVLDEAQQVKNNQSVGAHAVKRLTAHTRLALTGTPMENHAGELWSLMDFCLPGYLPPYPKFLRRYGEGQDIGDLKRRIRPFLMRRLKTDVLAELPERLESTLFAELTPEQRKVYDAVLLQNQQRVDEILRSKGMHKGRAEVLAAITQLRQICCTPELCMHGYVGGSGKEDLLMDVLPPALNAGSRALLFSQFTSMLRILEKRLKEAGIDTLYLDGETPPEKRQQLTESFNAGQGQVFLISLKAGGTGLNLTGADMVVHFDPWWNPTAQEQATGRAHRIGQTKAVTVLSLVTHGTIEEQVVNMSVKKRRLFDKLITAGEAMPTTLSDKDILSLFGR